MKKLVLRFYGKADLSKYNEEKGEWEPTEVYVKTDNPIIVAFPALPNDPTDYIAVYELEEVSE